MIVYENGPGSVVRLVDRAATCQLSVWRFANAKDGIQYETHNSIITRVTVGQNVNMQLLNALSTFVHVYVFGERPGTIGLAGLSFGCPCPGATTAQSHGLGRILSWYAANNAAKRTAPMDVAIGSVAFRAVVSSQSADVLDVGSGLVQWGLGLVSFPEP